MGRLEGKVALVTGGGTGIGAAIAKRFTDAGASVVITGRRSEKLQEAAAETGALPVPGDTTDPESCAAAVRAARDRFGRLDILVANAGIVRPGTIVTETDEDWQDTVDVNLNGPRLLLKSAIPLMLENGGGAVVIVSSIAGIAAFPEISSYVASKTAVIGLTRSAALDFGPRGIRVNAICPGWVRTPMAEEEMEALASQRNSSVDEAVRACVQYYPLGRMAEPSEIAACAEFLASDDASFVTGIALNVDGGSHIVDVGVLPFLYA